MAGVAQFEPLVRRWQALCDELAPYGVRLLVVSKYAPDAAVEALISAGQVDFAESRPQSLRDRARRWPQCRWHMIGPLHRNKAKYIGRFASMWHSVESLEQAEAVAAHVRDRELPVLVQVNLSGLPQQHGVAAEQAEMLCRQLSALKTLRVCGLMGMAPRGEGARAAFGQLRRLRERCLDGSLPELSMGMSHDYVCAVAEGATMVRIGSGLFGEWDTRLAKETGN